MVSRFLLVGAAAAMLFGGLILSTPTPASAEEAGIELAHYWGPSRHYYRPPPPPRYWRHYRRPYYYDGYRRPPPPPPYWRHHRRHWY